MNHVLLIDDDAELVGMFTEYLEQEGFAVACAHDGESGAREALSGRYAIAILDVMMPALNGIDTLRRIRAQSRIPVLMLTGRGDDADRILGLELGADDYVTKPFSFAILVARLRALVRRGAVARPTILEAGDLRLDPAGHHVWRGETPISLTAREFAVLEHLMRHRGQVLSKRDLLAGVWDDDFDGDPNIVEVYIGHLRRKVDKPFGREAIETIRGAGYRLAATGG